MEKLDELNALRRKGATTKEKWKWIKASKQNAESWKIYAFEQYGIPEYQLEILIEGKKKMLDLKPDIKTLRWLFGESAKISDVWADGVFDVDVNIGNIRYQCCFYKNLDQPFRIKRGFDRKTSTITAQQIAGKRRSKLTLKRLKEIYATS